MEKEKDNKEFKQTRLIIVLVAIIVVLVFALGFALGTRNSNTPTPKDNNKQSEKEKKSKKESKDDSEIDEDYKKEQEKIERDAKKEKELVEKAYSIVPNSYEIAIPFYRGKKIDLTKINPDIKIAWILSMLPEKYKMPVCSDERLVLTADEIKENSLFEDNSFIESLKKENDNLSGETDYYSTYFIEYKNDKFYAGNSNCDGRGTGPVDFERFAYDSYKKEGNELYIRVRFAYFKTIIPNDWDGMEQLKHDIYDSYGEKANLIYKGYDVGDYKFELNDKNSALYQFTFKIDGEKLYPLTVEKL